MDFSSYPFAAGGAMCPLDDGFSVISSVKNWVELDKNNGFAANNARAV
jgi:hypothetical protein